MNPTASNASSVSPGGSSIPGTNSVNSPGATARETPASKAPPVDFAAIKAKQQVGWASGDYSVVGTTLQIVGESLCEALDLRAGERVLDVACGNGNATLAAARRFGQVTGLDYTPALLARAGARAAAEGLTIELREGDAEALPFADGAFDVVLSTFGVMFAPDQDRAARELLRVCRHGGRIGLASWTPDGFVGQMFKVIGGYVPPPAGVRPPPQWGTEGRLAELFGAEARELKATRRDFSFRYRSPAHWLEVFRTWYGPVVRAFECIAPERREGLAADMLSLVERFNVARDGTAVIPGVYLETVISRV
jgi:ubiquinone/menaquinone biosynthesis C-methylase UbiE